MLINIVNKTCLAAAMIFFIGVASSGASAAIADKPIHVGHATKVVEDVQSQLAEQEKRRLVEADKVFYNENLFTADGAVVVIQFRDGSTLELGPKGVIRLDEFAFNPFENKSSKTLTLLRGSFRYVSGLAAKESDIKIMTGSGTIGIRGSAGSGFYYPGLPMFAHVSKGDGYFRNEAGFVSVKDGQSVASPGKDTQPIEPDEMSAAVAAEALGFVQSVLGSARDAVGTGDLAAGQRAEDAAANVIPTVRQVPAARPVAAFKLDNIPLPVLPLMKGAAEVGLLRGGGGATEEKKNFRQKAAAMIPNAAELVAGITAANKELNARNVSKGTTVIVTGISETAKDAKQVGTLVKEVVSANPDALKEAVGAAVLGGAGNGNFGSLEELIALSAEGAIAGVVDAGADITGMLEQTTEAAKGAVKKAGANIDPSAIDAAVSRGALKASANAGEQAAAIIQAALGQAVVDVEPAAGPGAGDIGDGGLSFPDELPATESELQNASGS